jgi:multiple sugar transport system permease protein
VSVASTVVSLVIGVPAAYALSRWTARGGAITLWILASRMAPPIAFTIPYFLAYRHLELLDTLTGLILIYLTFNLSLVIWMMRPFYDQLPRSLEEAAWIDGATMWQGFTASSCRSPGRASRRPRSSASCSPGTISSSP